MAITLVAINASAPAFPQAVGSSEVQTEYFRLSDLDDPRKGFLLPAIAAADAMANFQYCNGELDTVDPVNLVPAETNCDDEPAGTWNVSAERLLGSSIYAAWPFEGSYDLIGEVVSIKYGGDILPALLEISLAESTSANPSIVELDLSDDIFTINALENGTVDIFIMDTNKFMGMLEVAPRQ